MLKETGRIALTYSGKPTEIIEYVFGKWKLVIVPFGKGFPSDFKYEVGLGLADSDSRSIGRHCTEILITAPLAKVLNNIQQKLLRTGEMLRRGDTPQGSDTYWEFNKYGQGIVVSRCSPQMRISFSNRPKARYSSIYGVELDRGVSNQYQMMPILQSIVNDYLEAAGD